MIKIRKAAIDDVTAISALVTNSTREFIAPSLSDDGVKRLTDAMAVEYQLERFHGGYQFFVADDEGEVIGTSAVNPPNHLYYLFAKARYQGRGIGLSLMRAACEFLSQTTDPTEITVNSSLNAVAFYRRFGFMETGPIKNDQEVVFQPMRLTKWPLENKNGTVDHDDGA